MDSLIGHTGFVGQNLLRQFRFDACFNSQTIDQAAGGSFGTVVCSAAPGSMFDANRNPDLDREKIERLMRQLVAIRADRFVLISTIAVLKDFAAADEENCIYEAGDAYGVHRRMLEEFVLSQFPGALVVRLPALFGTGLKKNFLFDILNPMPSMLTVSRMSSLREKLGHKLGSLAESLYHFDRTLDLWVIDRNALANCAHRRELEEVVSAHDLSSVQFTNRETCFQYYDLGRLWADICLCMANHLGIVHLAPPPLQASEIHERIVGKPMPATPARLHREDMRTRHGALWGERGGYMIGKDEVWRGLAQFASAARRT